jgi:hypothetical protein
MSLKTVTVGSPREASTTGRERRRSSRKELIVESFIRSAENARLHEVTSVNLSRHGVAFHSPNPLVVSGNYIVEVGFGDQRLMSEVRIVSCREAGDGFFEIGAEFC